MTVIKDVSANSDSGTATKWGGNNIMFVDNYWDDIDVSASIVNGLGVMRINTLTRYRSGKLSLRDSGNDHNYIFLTSNLAANRNLTFPLLTADDTVAVLGLPQTFTDVQTIKSSSATSLLKLYRNSNSAGDSSAISFEANDSIGNQTQYAQIEGEIVDSTDGSEDAKLDFNLRDDGAFVLRFRINDNGLTEIFGNTTDTFRIDRDTGTNGDQVGMLFRMNDSGGNNTDYCRIRAGIEDNTDGAEDGNFRIYNVVGGTLSERFRIDSDGGSHIIGPADSLLTLYQSDSANASNGPILRYRGQDSLGNDQTYANAWCYIDDWTNGSEDSSFAIDICIGGSVINEFWFSDSTFGIRDGNSSVWGWHNVDRLSVVDKTMYQSNVTGSVVTAAFLSGTVTTTSNTVTETDLLNVTIPASAMGANGMCRVIVRGYITQNDAAGATYTFRTRLGGTIIHSDATNSYGASATKLPFRYEVDIYNKNSASANACNGILMINDTAGANTGIGDLGDDEISVNANFESEGADTTINTGSDTNLRVTIAMSLASASTSFTKKHYSVEVMTS